MQISLQNYDKLLLEIRATIKQTEQKIVATVNHEKVEMSWQLGKLLHQHLAKNPAENYGKKLFSQLAQDTSIKERILYQMRAFYKAYPTLPSAQKSLSWTHYRSLSSVKDSEKRQYLEELTINNSLGANQLQQEVTKANSKKTPTKPRRKKVKLLPKRGQLFAYKISEISGFVDCGFNIFCEANTAAKAAGEIVESTKKGVDFSLKKSTTKPDQLYTYKATLNRVVDGDTIHVTLDLGFKILHKEILRLAKINAPEAETFEGKKATEALKEILKTAPFLIVKTNKTDIYGRYIADVFFGDASEKNPQKIADSGTYLSQALLDRGVVLEY
ncbi:MAG: thermonuclease family protein [Rickettsiales bacterium]|nr:thermonuclease family protein [Rickettsiales bacterium]